MVSRDRDSENECSTDREDESSADREEESWMYEEKEIERMGTTKLRNDGGRGEPIVLTFCALCSALLAV
jgi:hypothetical protein